MSKKIGVVGSNMVDLITYVNRMPGPGETLEAPAFEMGCGGKGANQAVAAARLGADVMMVTRVGDDVFGDNTIRNLESFGVDTRHVVKVAGKSSGVAPIFVEQSGENSILIVKGANADLLPAEVDKAAADLKQCGLILMQMEVPVETVYHTIELAAQNGIETILNPAPAAANLDPERIRRNVPRSERERAGITVRLADRDRRSNHHCRPFHDRTRYPYRHRDAGRTWRAHDYVR